MDTSTRRMWSPTESRKSPHGALAVAGSSCVEAFDGYNSTIFAYGWILNMVFPGFSWNSVRGTTVWYSHPPTNIDPENHYFVGNVAECSLPTPQNSHCLRLSMSMLEEGQHMVTFHLIHAEARQEVGRRSPCCAAGLCNPWRSFWYPEDPVDQWDVH